MADNAKSPLPRTKSLPVVGGPLVASNPLAAVKRPGPAALGLPDPVFSGGEGLPTARTLAITLEGRVVGRLTYHLAAPPYAALQLLDIWVEEPRRRQKVGTRLWEMAMADARRLLGPDKLRRCYAGVGHKSHVLGRAFLTHHGFHHVTTTAGLYKAEDVLTYIKSYT